MRPLTGRLASAPIEYALGMHQTPSKDWEGAPLFGRDLDPSSRLGSRSTARNTSGPSRVRREGGWNLGRTRPPTRQALWGALSNKCAQCTTSSTVLASFHYFARYCTTSAPQHAWRAQTNMKVQAKRRPRRVGRLAPAPPLTLAPRPGICWRTVYYRREAEKTEKSIVHVNVSCVMRRHAGGPLKEPTATNPRPAQTLDFQGKS
jgi:hypothetical protein